MTTKEKAEELFKKYFDLTESIEWTKNENVLEECEKFNTKENVDVEFYWNQLAKKSALIAVDEICEILEDNGFTFIEYHDRTTIEYWLQVKQEIEKL
jgi:hypothetical protein